MVELVNHREGARPYPFQWNACLARYWETCQEQAYSVDGSKLKTPHWVRGFWERHLRKTMPSYLWKVLSMQPYFWPGPLSFPPHEKRRSWLIALGLRSSWIWKNVWWSTFSELDVERNPLYIERTIRHGSIHSKQLSAARLRASMVMSHGELVLSLLPVGERTLFFSENQNFLILYAFISGNFDCSPPNCKPERSEGWAKSSYLSIK